MTATHEQQRLRASRDALREEIILNGGEFKTANAIKCPFHDDRTPSASLYEKDGVWRFKCHGCGFCGDIYDVRARGNQRSVEDELKAFNAEHESPRDKKPAPKHYATVADIAAAFFDLEYPPFVYTNPETRKAELVVVRTREKHFYQFSPSGAGFIAKGPEKPWPIYNRTRIASAEFVVVVEGEKCVHALAKLGIVATTTPGGAGKAMHADLSPLAGKKCYLWADNDPADEKGVVKGVQHIRDIEAGLNALNPPAQVFVVDHAGLDLPPKGDVVDFIDGWEGESGDGLRKLVLAVLEVAEPTGPAKELYTLLQDTISGKRIAVPWPWSAMGRLSNALLPGTVTMIGGDPGSGKTFALLEALVFWFVNGHEPCAFMLEDDLSFHLNRVLAQLDERGELIDPAWVKLNPDLTNEAFGRHKSLIDEIGRRIQISGDKEIPLAELTEWVRKMAAAGRRVIVIDPVTAAAVSDKPWLDDRRFVIEVKAIARRFNCSIVLSTHPRKGKRQPGGAMDDMAGGAVYSRLSHNVFWLVRHDQPKPVVIASVCGDFNTRINRTMKLLKTRNGRGGGLEIGYDFQGKSLKFAEQGVIRDDCDEDAIESAITHPQREQLKAAS